MRAYLKQLQLRTLAGVAAALGLLLAAPAAEAAPARTPFDHITTGFELLGQHRDLPCESCHVNAIFKGTPHDCSACHGVGTAVHATAKPANHILASERCEACHSPNAWNPAVTFDHTEARGSCSSCHNNVQAQGKGPTHIDTDLECDACHSTIGWAGAVFNHAGITSGCASCHDNVHATGKPASHIPTTLPCESCHFSTSTWTGAIALPPNHIPTSAPCQQCHTNASDYSQYSVVGTHQGVTDCLSCHAPAVAATFDNVTIKTLDSNHMPIGALDCGSSGCHSTANVSAGGFSLGAASITAPTLGTMGHATVAGAVAACQTCHESAPYLGMLPSTASTVGDSRPSTALDKNHPASGDCGGCHTSSPTFAGDLTSSSKPANHIPTSAACTQCHTTGDYTQYSVVATHQGVTTCVSCHGPSVANTFANVTLVTTSASHIPIGNLDCNGSGCHTTANVSAGGFLIGAASITTPTLNIAGHTSVAGAVAGCQTCHETAPYQGMLASTATSAGDSRPTALDSLHPTSGDCGSCHTTTPTFGLDVTAAGKPPNHIPTNAPCAQCHTNASNYAQYSVTGTHQGVTTCSNCHGSSLASTFANVTITTTSGSHIPIGNLDCNGSGCHSTANVSAGGFQIGPASITAPTLNAAGHTTVLTAVAACQTCHETAPYQGMIPSTNTTAGDSRPNATLDAAHPAAGDCGGCHLQIPTFASDVVGGAKPVNHIPTSAPCTQCHLTPGDLSKYSVTGTHQGVSSCSSCHGSSVANTFANITITTTSASHIPIGNLDCNGSGCHTAANVNPGGFVIGAANITTPTLNVAGHTTVAGAVAGCQTCHESAPYQGMLASTASSAGDSRPTALDALHPTSGDCGGCHTTTPTFGTDVTSGATKPANHMPTTAACVQCHTTPGNYAAYSVTGTHQGVTTCMNCHGSSVASTFANITIATTSASHIPIGNLDCNGSGCHTAANVNPGGFVIGAASITTPTLNVAGHTTVAGAVAACQTCHETAPYQGMIASTATSAGDSRPTAFDKQHPTSGDCSGCHTTTPTFGTDQTAGAKPANHIPTSAACAQCHTTAGNYAAYSVTGTHQGVTTCVNCHGSSVASTFANITIVTTSASHIPIGSLDCNGSGCHSTANVNPGGFLIGAASTTTPTLNVAGHTTAASAVASCQTCHETAPYQGMLASTASTWGDSRPTAYDKSHPTTGDCNGCHTTTPTFLSDVTSAAKPSNHIPTSQACTLCHTTAGNYAAYVMGATGHTGITIGCATCHADGLSFANMAPPTLVEPPTGATGHVPIGSAACELCHSTTNFTTFAGTVMKHAVVKANACDSCHEYGMTWKTNTGVQLWTRPEKSHHAGQDCGGSGCHTARDKFAVRRPRVLPATPAARTTQAVKPLAQTAVPAPAPGSHPTVGSNACVSCHGAASGMGKPAAHIATTNACQSCHTTLAWMPVLRVDHTQVSGTCFSCHNGTLAVAKPATHIASSTSCETCHTTNSWAQVRVDHSQVVARSCRTCHDSVHATGLPVNHVPTQQSCDTCHGTLTWTPAKLDHTALTATCASCHNGAIATGRPSAHLQTRLDCGACHRYPDWSVMLFRHSTARYPGPHRAALDCEACHTGNTDQVPYASVANAGTCAGCHAKDFKPDAHPANTRGKTYTASELANCTGACHVYDPAHERIVKQVPGSHHRVSDAQFKH